MLWIILFFMGCSTDVPVTFYCQDTDLWWAATQEAEQIGCDLELVGDPEDADFIISTDRDWLTDLHEACQ